MSEIIFPKEFKENLKAELRSELLEELLKRRVRFDSSDIELIMSKTRNLVDEIPRFDSKGIVQDLLKQVVLSETERNLAFNKDRILTKEVRIDFINDVLSQIVTPKDGADGKDGKIGKNGKDGKNYSFTQEDKLDILESIDTSDFIKADFLNKTLSQFLKDIWSKKIKLPQNGGANGPEIVAKINAVLGTPNWQNGLGPNTVDADELVNGWNDITSALSGARAVGGSVPTFATFIGGLKEYSFSASAMQELHLEAFHIGHDYKPESDIFFHIHWSPSDTNTGVVRWGIEFTVAKGHNQQVFPATTTIFLEQAGNGVAMQHQLIQVEVGTNLNIEPDTLILGRIFRDGAHDNDTYTGAAFGHEIDLHYETDRLATLNNTPDFYTPQ